MRSLRKIVVASLGLACVCAMLTGCFIFGFKGGYTFTGASIPPGATTFSVAFIPNNSTDVMVSLSNELTEGLRDRFSRQTRLNQVPEGGDLAFEGEIVSTVEAPIAIGAASTDGRPEGATMNRVTVTVRIRFTNVLQPELSFDQGQTFSAYEDFDSVMFTRSDVESQLTQSLVETLVENIFNAAVAQW